MCGPLPPVETDKNVDVGQAGPQLCQVLSGCYEAVKRQPIRLASVVKSGLGETQPAVQEVKATPPVSRVPVSSDTFFSWCLAR